MPTNHPDYVTGAELSRWMQEQNDFRQRLEARLGAQHSEIVGTLRRIEDQVRETNGRTTRNTEAVAVIQRDVEAIRSEDAAIEESVKSIRDEGCSQYLAHAQLLRELAPDGGPRTWSRPRKVAAIGGIATGGAVGWMVLSKVIDLAVAHLNRVVVR